MAGNESFDLGLGRRERQPVTERLADIQRGAPLAGEPPKPKTIQDISLETGVPWNVIETVVQDSGVAPEQSLVLAQDFAQKMKQEIDAGRDIPSAMRSIFGDDAPIEDALARAVALAGRGDEGRASSGQNNENPNALISGAISSASAAAQALGFDETADNLSERAASRAPEIASYKDVEGIGDAARYVGGAILQSLPEMAVVAGAAAATILTGGGALLAAGAALGTSTLFNAGRAAQRQDEETGDIDYAKAWGAGLAMGALDAIVPGKVGGGLAKVFSTRTAGAAATVAARKSIGREALETGLEESVTELGQFLIEIGQAKPDLLRIMVNPREDEMEKSDELLTEAIDSILGGGSAGAAFGGGAAAARRVFGEGGVDEDGAPDAPLGLPAPDPQPSAPDGGTPDSLDRPALGNLARAAQAAPKPVEAPAPIVNAQAGQPVRVTMKNGMQVDAEFVGEDGQGVSLKVNGEPALITRKRMEQDGIEIAPVDVIGEAAWADAETSPTTNFEPLDDTTEPPAKRAERLSGALDTYLSDQKIDTTPEDRAEIANSIDRFGGTVEQAVADLLAERQMEALAQESAEIAPVPQPGEAVDQEPVKSETPVSQGGTDVSPAQNQQPVKKLDGTAWGAMAPEQRQALLASVGFKDAQGNLNAPGRRAAGKEWAALSDRLREKLAEQIDPQAQAGAPVAPVADPNRGLGQNEIPAIEAPAERPTRTQPGVNVLPDGEEPIAMPGSVAAAATETEEQPTEGQKEAENYKTGKADWMGLKLSVENRKGTERSKKTPDGKTEWSVTMPAHYGRILRTKGADGDHVDFYMGDNEASENVWVIDQMDAETGRFDEHKVMLGFNNANEVAETYMDGFSDKKGPDRLGGIKKMTVDEFKEWLASGDTTKPVTPKATRGDKAAANAEPERKRPQIGSPDYTLIDAMNDLIDMQAEEAAQGMIGDARLLSRIERQKALIKRMEKEADDLASEKPKKPSWGDIDETSDNDPKMPEGYSVSSYSRLTKQQAEEMARPWPSVRVIVTTSKPHSWAVYDGWSDVSRTEAVKNALEKAQRAVAKRPENQAAQGKSDLPGGVPDGETRAEDQGAAKIMLRRARVRAGAINDNAAYSKFMVDGRRPVSEELVQEAESYLRDTQAQAEDAAKALDEEANAESQFVPAPDGSVDLGQIGPEVAGSIGRQSGPIRMRLGDLSSGLTHIVSRHDAQIKSLGFANAVDFVSNIAKNFNAIYKREGRAIDLVLDDGGKGLLIVQLEPSTDGDFYDVRTATPIRSNQYQRKTPLWERSGPRTPSTEADPLQNPKGQSGNANVTPAPEKNKPSILSALSDEKQARAAELKRLLAEKARNQTSSGLDPEYITLGGELVALYIEAGTKRFAEMLRDFADTTGLSMREAQAPMRAAYNHVRDDMDLAGQDVSDMDDAQAVMAEVRRALAEEDAAPEQVQTPPEDDTLDPQTPETPDEQPSNQESDQGEPTPQEAGLGAEQPVGEPDGEPSDDGRREDDEDGAGEPSGDDESGSLGSRPGSSADSTGSTRIGTPLPNYVITDDFALGEGTDGEKLAANMAALRLVDTLERENRYATPDEQDVLARWVGWGGLKTVFDGKHEGTTTQWGRAQAELKQLLSSDEYVAAMRSTNDAHYTSRTVVKAMWRAMRNFGFDGGRALEPTIGSGNFLGLQPADLSEKTEWFAAELDPVTGKIAKHLYPQAQVFDGMGFQDAPFRRAAFDVAIGNPPFGSTKIGNKKLHPDLGKMSVHNFIIAKTGQLLREGGVMSMVVTHRFLDTPNPEARSSLAPDFRFLGAIRLPNTAFEDNANTQVTTDIVFFQKRREGDRDNDTTWLETGAEGPNGTRLNRYFAENPDMILGRAAMDGTMYAGGRKKDGQGEFTVHADGRDLEAALNEAIDSIEAQIPTREGALEDATTARENSSSLPYGAMMLTKDGRIYRGEGDAAGNRVVQEVTEDTYWNDNAEAQGRVVETLRAALDAKTQGVPMADRLNLEQEARDAAQDAGLVDLAGEPVKQKTKYETALSDNLLNLLMSDTPSKTALDAMEAYQKAVDRKRLGTDGFARLSAMLDLRQRTRELIALERADADSAQIEARRRGLRNAYRKFQKKHGYINSSKNEATLRGDVGPEFALELGYKAATKDGREETAREAEILEKRVIYPHKLPDSVESVSDGLHVSMQERGHIDPGLIASLTGKPVEDVIEELVSGAEPLAFRNPKSGQFEIAEIYLSGNLAEKINAAKDAGLYQNVPHLKNAMPPPKTQEQITPSIRSLWMPASVFNDFLRAMGYARPSVTLLEGVGMASVDAGASGALTEFGEQFATERMNPAEIFEHAIKGKIPVVFDSVRQPDGNYKRIKNEPATREAVTAYERMTREFPEWAFANPQRAGQIVDTFNEKMNVVTEREYQGVRYLRMVGNSPAIDLRNSQKNGAWRMIQDKVTLLHHVVGAGKAQPLDAKLLTPNGWVRMGDIKPGDEVISQSGQPTVVEAVFPQGSKEIFKVTFSDGSSTECCDEHLWLTQTYQERGYAQRAAKLGKQWDCGKPKVRPLSEIRDTLEARHLGARNHSVPMVSAVDFTPRHVPLDGYLVGALLGDGHIGKKAISISSADPEVFSGIILPNGAKTRLAEPKDRCPSLHLIGTKSGENPVLNACRELGLTGLYSHEKFVPDDYKFNSREVRLSVLRGLMDTDGWVQGKGRHVCFASASERLVDDVAFLVQSFGGTARKSSKATQYSAEGEKKAGRTSYTLTVSMPPEVNPFAIDRKASAVVAKTKYQPTRYIVAVEPVGMKPAQCIRVADPSHLYVTDDFIVTHNTFTAIAGVMERKRMGLTRKAVVAVPNHLTGQWGREWLELYPAANILVPTEKDFEPANRAKLINRIATGDFDAVIVGHSQLTKIENDAETSQAYIADQIDELNAALQEAKRSGESKRTVGQIGTRLTKLQDKLKELEKKLSERADDRVIGWKDLGVDYMVVDEAHLFKNLEYTTTATQLVGMNPPGGSQRAFDMLMKVRVLQKMQGGGVSFLTGTPVSNSLVEIYSMMKYLIPESLESMNIQSFDSWKAAFIQDQSRFEYTASMQLKERNIMSGMINLGPLAQLYRSFADIVMRPDVERMFTEQMEARNANEPDPDKRVSTRFPTPKIKGGARRISLAPPTPKMQEFVRYLVMRMAGIKENKSNKAYMSVDNALWVLTDARKASVDIRTIDPTLGREEGSKVERASAEVFRLWSENAERKGTQMVFSDMSAPTKAAERDAKRVLKAAYEKLGLKGAALTARLKAEEGQSYAERWGNVVEEVDNIISSPDTDEKRRDRLVEFAESEAAQDASAAMFTADTGFSFYDDMKAALIEKGVPEKEIAFIHDYDTTIKKAALFEAVNEGNIRVLIGSTQKMGAGTNAQKRMVALHHIDAPWRPSDMEQREGRIIRQGNLFYQEDPDGFEVEIVAYSTEQTADVVQWQVLERKAASIETFLNAATDSIEEEGGDADQYAEFMAQSTGKEVFLQKMQAEKDRDTARAEIASTIRNLSEADRFIAGYDSYQRLYGLRAETYEGVSTEIIGEGADTYLAEWEATAAQYRAEKDRIEAERDEVRKRNADKPRKEWEKLPEQPSAPTRWDDRPEGGWERKVYDALSRAQSMGADVEIPLAAGFKITIKAEAQGGGVVSYAPYLVPPNNREVQAEMRLIDGWGNIDAKDFRRSDKLLNALSPVNIASRAKTRADYYARDKARHAELLPQMRAIKEKGVDMAPVDAAEARLARMSALVRIEEVKFATETASAGPNYFAIRDDKGRDLVADDTAQPLTGQFQFTNAGQNYSSEWGAPGGTRRIEGTDRTGQIAFFEAENMKTGEQVVIEAIETRKADGDTPAEWDVLNVYDNDPLADMTPEELERLDRALTSLGITSNKNADEMRMDDDGNPNVRASRAKPRSTVANLSGNELGEWSDVLQLGKKANKWYRDNLQGQSVTNEETGWTIQFSGAGARKISGRKGEDLLRLVPALREIVSQGRVVATEQDNRGRAEIKAIHKIAARVTLGGAEKDVITTIREAQNGTFYYDLNTDMSDEARFSLSGNDEATGRVGSAQVLDPALEVGLVSLNLEIADGFVKARRADFDAAAGDTITSAPEARKAMRKVRRALRDELAKFGIGTRITLDVREGVIDTFPGLPPMDGYFLDGVIGIAADTPGGYMGVLRHEVIHALRNPQLWGNDYGLFTAQEWRTLVRAARQNTRLMDQVNADYDGLSDTDKIEEVVAEMFREWMETRDTQTALGRAFDKLRQMLDAIVTALRGEGLNDAAAVFDRIRSGEVGGRGPDGPGRGANVTPVKAKIATPRDAGRISVQARNLRSGLSQLASDAVTNAMGANDWFNTLALVPGRPLFNELGKGIPAAQRYLALKEKMDTKRDDKHAETDKVAQQWRRLANKNKDANAEMMKLMHDSTIAGVDPSERFVSPMEPRDELIIKSGRVANPIAYEAALERKDRHERLQKAHDELSPRFKALPESLQELYRDVRDTYRRLDDEQTAAILGNVERAMTLAIRRAEREHRRAVETAEKNHAGALRRIGADKALNGTERATQRSQAKMKLDRTIADADEALAKAKATRSWTKDSQVRKLRAQFETNKLSGPYFPLARFGKYFVLARDEEGNVQSFSRHETVQQQRAAQKDMEDEGFSVQIGVMQETDARDLVDPAFVADIERMLEEVNADEKLMDDIWQRWLETLPDMSIRKHRIHRKNREGYDADALRAFGHHMFHGSHQLARLLYSLEMQEELDVASEEAAASEDPVRKGFIVNEMKRHHNFTMNPKGEWWASALTGFNFVYYLSVSPAAAAVNLSQTSIVGTTVLGRYGGTKKAAGALTKALVDFTQSPRWHSEKNTKNLTEDERAAMHEAYRRGVIARTESHNLASVAESGLSYSPAWVNVMSKISFLFHHSERMNREVTFLAAYRLLRDQGRAHEESITEAGDATWKVHFDYQSTSKARFMQGPIATVAFAFKNFTVNFLWRIFRDLHQSVNGADQETRREARRQAGVMATMMLFHAGIKGIYGYGLVMALMGMFFPGEDDPEENLEKIMIDYLPTPVVKAMLDGVPGSLAGIDLTSRIGMPNIWFREPFRPLDGVEGLQFYVNQLLGPTFGIAENLARGTQRFLDGVEMRDPSLMWRGVETAVPKAVRDVMKGGRYAYEGALTYNGDPIKGEFSTFEVIAQASGFTPKALADQYEQNSRAKNKERAITDRRKNVIKQAAEQIKAGKSLTPRQLKLIEEFNRDYPFDPITTQTITRSVRSRVQSSERNEAGISLNPRLDAYIRSSLSPLLTPG